MRSSSLKNGCYIFKQKGKKNVLLIYAPLYKGLPGRDEVMGYSKLTYEDYIKNPCVWNIVPPKWVAELSEKGYKGISAIDFYDDIFGDDLEVSRLPEDYISGEYAGIAVERVPQFYPSGKPKLNRNGQQEYKGKRHTITQGNVELYDLIEKSENFCMISPISYIGKNRTIENARYLYALCIEVDYIEPKHGIDELIYSWERDYKPIPKPTYIVCSGNGLHIYYVFERPLPLRKNVYISLNEAKKYLTPRFWTALISLLDALGRLQKTDRMLWLLRLAKK